MATKPFLSQIAVPVGTTTGDVYYPQTSLLMHFNGTNGSTTMTDSSKNNFTVTATNGAALSTVQSKFGGSSVYFDGTNDYLSISSPTPGFSFGTGDFTIEAWVYKTVNSGTDAAILDARSGNTASPWTVYLNSSNFPYFYDGTSYTSTIAVTLNTWFHLAWVRTSGVLKIFVNGVQGYSAAHSVNLDRTAGLMIGIHVLGSQFPFGGYIDDLRITKGVARYTSNFTPPSTQFPDNAGLTQYATKYIGLIGGLNDRSVDYGIQKLSDTSLKVVKMSQTTSPFPSGSLSASVDRVYVNVLDYTKVNVTSSYSLLSKTSSYALNSLNSGGTGESFHPFLLA